MIRNTAWFILIFSALLYVAADQLSQKPTPIKTIPMAKAQPKTRIELCEIKETKIENSGEQKPNEKDR